MSLNRQLILSGTFFLVMVGVALWLRRLEDETEQDFVRQASDELFCGTELMSCQRRVSGY
jgi:hypothetical protein